jgi:hypothetical protein
VAKYKWCGSGSRIRRLFDPWIRDPGWVKKSGSGFWINNPEHISESLEIIFWVKILKFFDVDPGWKKFGSINIPIPQHSKIQDQNTGAMDPIWDFSQIQIQRLSINLVPNPVSVSIPYPSQTNQVKKCCHT